VLAGESRSPPSSPLVCFGGWPRRCGSPRTAFSLAKARADARTADALRDRGAGIELLALGKTNRQIAEDFVLSMGTLKNHVEHIIAKLNVSDRTQAVVRALEPGIISFSGQ